ncbi:MAG TPA: FKBP-type peptidyl-prolyl cis-trans isomerase [Phycisphaerae bacterium]|nr:FKBP-type peptidyl-prolyl cis-trans isomerase [Phycisphaerae bacterium]
MNIRQAAVVAGLVACASIAFAQTQPTSTTAPATATATAPSAFKSDKERMAYALGLQLGKPLNGMDIEIDPTAFTAGFKDSASGAPSKLTEKEVDDAIAALQGQLKAAQAALPERNQKAGDAFLADNGKKDGVKTTASGLQYKVIKSGAGKTPKASDTVSVHYRGTLINGTEFDASGDKAVSFPVNQVIPGWTEALQLMKEGDKWQLFIPAKLAYGERGAGQDIGPNSALIFEVELLEVK